MKNFSQRLLTPKIIGVVVFLIAILAVCLNATYAWFSDKSAAPAALVDLSGVQNAIPMGGMSSSDTSLQVEVTADGMKKSWYPGETMGITLTVSNPNTMPIVFRVAKSPTAEELLNNSFLVENIFSDPNNPDNQINRIFGEETVSAENGSSVYYYGQLLAGKTCEMRVTMALKGQDLPEDGNSYQGNNIQSFIRVDICQSSVYAVKDYFNFDVVQDANGLLQVKP
ncbi:MAG: hypothetical protein LBT44_02355 [Clostridiales bacterium]|nr:hypothetical protein [Clostridiales bacterium]